MPPAAHCPRSKAVCAASMSSPGTIPWPTKPVPSHRRRLSAGILLLRRSPVLACQPWLCSREPASASEADKNANAAGGIAGHPLARQLRRRTRRASTFGYARVAPVSVADARWWPQHLAQAEWFFGLPHWPASGTLQAHLPRPATSPTRLAAALGPAARRIFCRLVHGLAGPDSQAALPCGAQQEVCHVHPSTGRACIPFLWPLLPAC